MQHVAAFLFVLILFLGFAWIAGCNFEGTWSDPFEYDHPENFARHIIGE
jgi:hypothetical protein